MHFNDILELNKILLLIDVIVLINAKILEFIDWAEFLKICILFINIFVTVAETNHIGRLCLEISIKYVVFGIYLDKYYTYRGHSIAKTLSQVHNFSDF